MAMLDHAKFFGAYYCEVRFELQCFNIALGL